MPYKLYKKETSTQYTVAPTQHVDYHTKNPYSYTSMPITHCIVGNAHRANITDPERDC